MNGMKGQWVNLQVPTAMDEQANGLKDFQLK
jgi:hypothetical protein